MFGLLDALTSLVFPLTCSICSNSVESAHNGDVCSACWSETEFFQDNSPICQCCSRRFERIPLGQTASCSDCIGHYYDKVISLGPYEKGIKASVIHLKTNPRVPKMLRKCIEERLSSIKLEADTIIPVPLSRERRFERGFNQAELVADVVARSLSIKMDAKSLVRIAHTVAHRAGMDRKARANTVEKAFKVAREGFVKEKRVLLVDDVLTTGSTVSACARELRRSGAVSVNVFTIARA